MLPVTPDYFTLSYRPEEDVLVARWMRTVSLEEMCEGYLLLREAATTCRCRQWLIDARRRYNTHREGAHWMLTEFLPTLYPRLGGRTRLAYVLAPVLMRDAEADAAFPPASYFDDKPFAGAQFTDERAALEWLQQGRA